MGDEVSKDFHLAMLAREEQRICHKSLCGYGGSTANDRHSSLESIHAAGLDSSPDP